MDLDLATALEVPLEDSAAEAKFNALKKLQTLKVKALMTSIDALQKENAKLKVLGKDSRRTQMIQSLNKKLKDQELVVDFLKAELVGKQPEFADAKQDATEYERKVYTSLTEVNNFVIKKTLGGPKRFRPLSREEMENKIIEYEKTVKRLATKFQDMESDYKRGPSNAPAEPKSARWANRSENKLDTKDLGDEDSIRVLQLMDQVTSLKIDLEAKNVILDDAKVEIARLRTRNAELKAVEESNNSHQKVYEEMYELYQRTRDELDDAVTTLAQSREEVLQIRASADAELEAQKVEFDSLQESYASLLRQNNALLLRLTDAEGNIDVDSSSLSSPQTAKNSQKLSQQSSSPSTANNNRVYEQKIASLRARLVESESRIRELEEEPGKGNQSTEEMRAKNNEIRDLKRALAEIAKRDPISSPTSSQSFNFLVDAVDGLVAVLNDVLEKSTLSSPVMYPLDLIRAHAEGMLKSDEGLISRDRLSALVDVIIRHHQINEENDGSPFGDLRRGGGGGSGTKVAGKR